MIDDRYILAPARQCLAPVYYRILLIYRNLVINNNQQKSRYFPITFISSLTRLTVTSCHFYRVFTNILSVLEQVSSNTSSLNGFYSSVTTDYYRETARLILHPIYRLISTQSLWKISSEKDRYISLHHNAFQSER